MKSLFGKDTPSRITYRKTYHPSLREKFWSFVNKNTDTGCWEWIGYRNKKNYGMFKALGDVFYAHRTSWEFLIGEIPDGILVLHKCDNPPCVNPEHLFLGTHQDNMDDMSQKGRGRTSPKRGNNNPHIKISDEQVREIRSLYSTGDFTYYDLSDRYGVSYQLIGNIVNKKSRVYS